MNTHETPIQLSMPLTPWAQLVTPILVARTSARRARPIAQEFLRRYPTPAEYLRCRCSGGREALFLVYLDQLFKPLGLSAVRTATVDRIAEELKIAGPALLTREMILDIPGCGRYVADSFDLFYRGNLDCEPLDPVLIAYRNEVRRRFADVQNRSYRTFTASRCLECETEKFYEGDRNK